MAGRLAIVIETVGGAVQIAGTIVGAPVLRRWYLRWGATPEECSGAMPGDELIEAPMLGYTRAVTIDAPPARVWPWLAQIGQGRGGLYSFDLLENLIGCRIHSADTVLPEHQNPPTGTLIRLGPDGYPCHRVITADPPRALVLVGVDPHTHEPPPLPVAAATAVTAATWQWQLRPLADGAQTRLLTRQRLTYPRRQSVLWHVVEPINFVMERKMLRGIKHRAERPVPTDASGAWLAGSR
jgi:hypothetical protein